MDHIFNILPIVLYQCYYYMCPTELEDIGSLFSVVIILWFILVFGIRYFNSVFGPFKQSAINIHDTSNSW